MKANLYNNETFDRLFEDDFYKIHTDSIIRLKEEKYPILLFGAGVYAKRICEFLDKYGIHPDAAFVDCDIDNKYLQINDDWQINVHNIDEVFKIYGSKIHLINAHQQPSKTVQLFNSLADGISLSEFENTLWPMWDRDFVLNNRDDFKLTYNMLDDALSKEIMVAFIKQKMSGCSRFTSDFYQPLEYFPPDIVRNYSMKTIIDGGAYDGDTAEKFSRVFSYEKIIAFEPDNENFLKLEENTKKIKNITCINAALSDKNEDIVMNAGIGVLSSIDKLTNFFSTVDQKVRTLTLDSMNLCDVSLIKLDIEGSELAALQGAKKTVSSQKPMLGICVYHKPEDLITIPQYIKTLNPEYKLYLRKHSLTCFDFVLYAI